MIGISRLYLGIAEESDSLRYKGTNTFNKTTHQFKPIIVWNLTKKCNLRCIHCYSEATNQIEDDELNTHECKKIIDSLSSYQVPVLLFSGGEPLLRKDFFELASYTTKKGIRAVLSTNGTLITKDIAKQLKRYQISYVGISLDGMQENNDKFRGVAGSFNAAIDGIRNCLSENLKVGMRFTITKKNAKDIKEIFSLAKEENIHRICFYHLVYSGRGSQLIEEDLNYDEKRQTIDTIIDQTYQLYLKGYHKEVLTVDNYADGVYLYLRMQREKSHRCEEVLSLLKKNGGNSSAVKIGCVLWNGEVYPDQFWCKHSLGNLKYKDFKEIWEDSSNEFLQKLRNRHQFLKGRCSSCRWIEICNGNLRARAEAVTGDIWAEDPACYLSNEEIS